MNKLQAMFYFNCNKKKRLKCFDWWQKTFYQPIKNDWKTYNNITKLATGQQKDYTTDSLLHHDYFQSYYKMIATDISKQQTLEVDPKTIQQIINQAGNNNVFLYWRTKRNNSKFFTEYCKSITNLFCFDIIFI